MFAFDLQVYSIHGVVNEVTCKAETRDDAITDLYGMIIESGARDEFVKVI